jgi:hypothetical protein
MGSTTAAVVMVVVLAARHLKTRRHANWKVSADARFYITSGYPLVAIAVYFLTSATSNTDWAWVGGNLWALVAMTAFVYGFNALNEAQQPASRGTGGNDENADASAEHPSFEITGSKRLAGSRSARQAHRQRHR